MSIAKTQTEPTYLPLVAHIDEELEALQAERTADTFDRDELKLFEMLLQDLRIYPIAGLPVYRRRGIRTFIISIDQKVEMSLRTTLKGDMACSRLVLSSDTPYCRQEILQRVVQAACDEVEIMLVKEVTFRDIKQSHLQLFAFTVDFG